MDVLTRTLNSMVLSEQHAAKRFEIECSVLRYLKHGDRTVRQIGSYLDLEDRAVRSHLARLLYEKKIHICGWEKIGVANQHNPVLRGGAGDNIAYPNPKVLNSLVKALLAYAAKIEGADEVEFKRPPTVVNVRRDPLVEALFGKAA